ncbi:hypothetical protein MMC17_004920 [Xylographa soralifera]|nr:hypothetical protein [Xylographa soralifera]
MPSKSSVSFSVPTVSIPTLLFTSPTSPLSSQPSIIDAQEPENRYLTKATYRLYSQRLAVGLLAHGIEVGDRLLLFSGNNIFFPVVFIGTIMAGGIFTGANPGYVARELAHQLRDSGAKFLFCAAESLDAALDAAAQTGLRKDRIFVFDNEIKNEPKKQNLRGCRHWSTLLSSAEEGENYEWNPCSTIEEADQTCILNYSSGTTGLPKGVEISHRNYVATALAQQMWLPAPTTSDRELCFLPLYHALAQMVFTIIAPMREVPVYMMPRFDFQSMLHYVQKYRISYLVLVPPILVALTKHPGIRAGKWDLSSVQNIGCGAAPLGLETIQELASVLGQHVRVTQGYGMTELTCQTLGAAPVANYKSSTVGILLPNCEAQIVDDEGVEVARGEPGELWIRSPTIMKGYWRNPKATSEIMAGDGWLKTGDVCYMDKDGLFYIVDRKKAQLGHPVKELIKVKGNQVAPAELEALLLDHPAVSDAAVIGITRNGEECPRAYIVVKEGHHAPGDDIVAFVEKRVSKHKRITGGVLHVDAIPRNPSGKILRKVLRENAKENHGQGIPKL